VSDRGGSLPGMTGGVMKPHEEVMTSLHQGAPLRRLSADEYGRMVDAGILYEDERVELMEGLLVFREPQSVPHAQVLQRLNRLLVRAVGENLDVRVQMPVYASEWSVPEPDLAIVPIEETERRDSHPRRALLLVEVAKTTLAYDRGPKLSSYARMKVPEYWVVNTVAEEIEVYRRPVRGRYRSTQVYRRGQHLRPRSVRGVSVNVAALFW
jgi:Uma2 family endonuclease